MVVDFSARLRDTLSRRVGAMRASRPKPSAKNATGNTRNAGKPFTWGDFDGMVERAIRTPARKPAPKSNRKSNSPGPSGCT